MTLRRTPLKRSGRLRARSTKRATVMIARRDLVAQLLEERPVCERCHNARSVDLHERLRRSQGGDILDASDIRCLCRPCHDWIGRFPLLAHAEGWTRRAWEAA